METNRLMALVAALVVAVVAATVVVPRLFDDDDEPVLERSQSEASADRTLAPVVDGRVIGPVSPDGRPPLPTQWDAGAGAIRSNTWWSSAVTGPGAMSLWPQPLALAIDEAGTVRMGAPRPERVDNGSVVAPLVPALFLETDQSRATSVIDHGPLHVRLRLRSTERQVDLTLVSGSPLVEITSASPVQLRVPGLDIPSAAASGALRLDSSEGPWLLAGIAPDGVEVDGDLLTVTPAEAQSLVVGPVPAGADDSYDTQVAEVAAHPLITTSETIEVDPDGTTRQTLTQTRDGSDRAGLWALQPHHQHYGVDLPDSSGTVPSALGDVPVVATSELDLAFPAVPILWSSVAAPDAPAPDTSAAIPAAEGIGSYFGGKTAYAAAAHADVLRAAGADDAAAPATDAARALLDQLIDSGREPVVRWDSTWGSAVIEPAEFGAGSELNDHQLQYGYWVAAAAHLAEGDRELADQYRDTIDLLIADYAGASMVPDAPRSLPAERTWSPYAGHSWASGTAPFADGNNLESISESTFSSWAAARWFLATDRADAADAFIGRFTIESALADTSWLPTGEALPQDPTVRPWSGVVWSGKVDINTWFDPQDESALGIRLLPVGPAGLARYGSAERRAAADARWTWCDQEGDGCTSRWANLLDSDAVVAGRPPLDGPEPEPSTGVLATSWWRALWGQTEPVDGWSCSPGVVVRRTADGDLVVLASDPRLEPTQLRCVDPTGTERWSATITQPTAAPLP